VNIGRAAVQEGDMDRARTVLEKALTLSPDLARAHFFYAKVLRADGKYEEAADHLRTVIGQYPRDRVALNDLGRILFLQRKYADAVSVLQRVLEVDPEDLQAHYNLMLCYNGLGDEKQAKEHQVRYLRFKADEASQAITGNYRRLNPEDNNERQPIHEHLSVPLASIGRNGANTSVATTKNAEGAHRSSAAAPVAKAESTGVALSSTTGSPR
jgi:tetratricopeptide (TPR) repeat protein